ncbi:MBL fold metallo-hydrolase [Candidatus Shapirobacteria bacterium]|nr:MBL fold metallo-hydrolase [Candidatus Shapirobacteria bacterium]
MEIKYFGNSCFRIKGKQMVLLTNPFEASVGIKLSGLVADIVCFSHKKESSLSSLVSKAVTRGEVFVIDAAGEYEVGGVFIMGIEAGATTLYVMTIDGLRLVFLGELKEKLTDKQIEEVDGADLLFLPVGDKNLSLSAKQAVDVINQIEPKIIIPMAYKIPGLNLDLAPLDDFLKEMSLEEKKTPLEKLIISKDKLPLEKEVVVLNARS